MKTCKLYELAKTIRSKNAGPDNITFDIIFAEKETYEKVKRSGAITREAMAKLYSVPEDKIVTFVEYDPGNAFKFTFRRDRANGTLGESDLFGCQQYGPLINCEVNL